MLEFDMETEKRGKWTLLKLVGLAAAMVLILFGSFGNLWRTIKTVIWQFKEDR